VNVKDMAILHLGDSNRNVSVARNLRPVVTISKMKSFFNFMF
jgi:hypothetical protein